MSQDKRRITLERTYRASVDDVWDLWTTKEGIESWWGPDAFRVEVRRMDLRPGGEMHYAMIAAAAPQIEFMKQHGMPLSQEVKITYTEVTPKRRLAWDNLVDFVPGTAPYSTGTAVELFAARGEVRMVVTIDAMHSEEWTQRAVMGWEQEIGKLDRRLAR